MGEIGPDMESIAKSTDTKPSGIGRRTVLAGAATLAAGVAIAGLPETANAQAGPAATATQRAREEAEIQRRREVDAARRAAQNPPPAPPPVPKAPAAPGSPEIPPGASEKTDGGGGGKKPPGTASTEPGWFIPENTLKTVGLTAAAVGTAGLIGLGVGIAAGKGRGGTAEGEQTAQPPAPQRKWWWPFGKKPADRQVSPPGPETPPLPAPATAAEASVTGSVEAGDLPRRTRPFIQNPDGSLTPVDTNQPVTIDPTARFSAEDKELFTLIVAELEQQIDRTLADSSGIRLHVDSLPKSLQTESVLRSFVDRADRRGKQLLTATDDPQLAELARVAGFHVEPPAGGSESAPAQTQAPEVAIPQGNQRAYDEIIRLGIYVELRSTVDTLMQQLKRLSKPWQDNQPTRDHIQSAIDYSRAQATELQKFLPTDLDPSIYTENYIRYLLEETVRSIDLGEVITPINIHLFRDIAKVLTKAGYTFETTIGTVSNVPGVITRIYNIHKP